MTAGREWQKQSDRVDADRERRRENERLRREQVLESGLTAVELVECQARLRAEFWERQARRAAA